MTGAKGDNYDGVFSFLFFIHINHTSKTAKDK